MSDLNVIQIGVIKALVDTLHGLNVSPLHLHVDTKTVGDMRPDITMWTQTRTDFERLCSHLSVKSVEARYSPQGQRQWHASHDTPERRLLIQCVSFEHHDDWEPKGSPVVGEQLALEVTA